MDKDISTHQADISGTLPVSSGTTWDRWPPILKISSKKIKTKGVLRPYSGISTIKALAILILRFITIVSHDIYCKIRAFRGISKQNN